MCSRSWSGTSFPRLSTNSLLLMIRPSRTMSTCTPAMVSSRKNPMTSASRLRELTACCLSHSPFIVSIRALIRPALSKSSSAAASCISCESSSTNSRWLPERKRSIRLTLAAYCSGVTRPQHAPGPKPTCASKHGRTSVAKHASESFSSLRFSERQSAQLEEHNGTTRLAMSTMRRAARLSV